MSRKSISIASHYLQIGTMQAVYPLLTVTGDGKACKLDRFTHEQERTTFLNGRLRLSCEAYPASVRQPRTIPLEEMALILETHSDWEIILPNGEILRSLDQLQTLG